MTPLRDLPRLFEVPVDERCLGDADRTILESIDSRGPISANEAGRIVYRLRGYRNVRFVRRVWVTSAGAAVLRKLERNGLVRRSRGSRWIRAERLCSDLIGLYVVETSISTVKTPKAFRGLFGRHAQVDPAHAHDTPANRRFLGVSGPVTSSESSSVASRSAEIYGERRTEPLAPPASLGRRGRLVRGCW